MDRDVVQTPIFGLNYLTARPQTKAMPFINARLVSSRVIHKPSQLNTHRSDNLLKRLFGRLKKKILFVKEPKCCVCVTDRVESYCVLQIYLLSFKLICKLLCSRKATYATYKRHKNHFLFILRLKNRLLR